MFFGCLRKAGDGKHISGISGGEPCGYRRHVYFSRYGNTEYPDDVDATTSASIVADGTGRYGTTEYIANMIQ